MTWLMFLNVFLLQAKLLRRMEHEHFMRMSVGHSLSLPPRQFHGLQEKRAVNDSAQAGGKGFVGGRRQPALQDRQHFGRLQGE